MKITKILAFLLAALMVFTCFVACGGGAEETETEVVETEGDASKETVNSNLDAYGRELIEDSVPDDLNYGTAANNIVTFFTRNDSETLAREMDSDELIDDTLNDAIYRRNITVEEQLGVTITQISQLGNWGSHTEWLQTLRNAVNTKSGDFDSGAVYASQGAALALEGMYYNILNLEAIDLEKPWWNKQLVKELELFDTLYFLGGDITISQVTESGITVYNKAIFEKYFPDVNLYELVDSYQWTVDKLYELSSQVWEDTNTTGMLDDGDVIGYKGYAHSGSGGWMDIWIAALGLKIAEKNSDGIPELSFYNARSIDSYEKLKRLHMENTGSISMGLSETSFINDKIMFSATSLGACENLRDMTSPYGALPMPAYDEEQGYYGTYPQNACSLLTILSSVPEDRIDMVGYTIELMAAESYRQVIPEYYSVCLKTKYSAEAEDARMYDIIIDSISIDFGFVYASTQISGILSLFRNLSNDFAQTYEANSESYATKLDTLIDKLDEISFLG